MQSHAPVTVNEYKCWLQTPESASDISRANILPPGKENSESMYLGTAAKY